MDVSPLRIGNEAFLVASMIERCPKVMMLRELVTNALEAASQAPDGARRVEVAAVDIDGTRKLAIWNAGPGMDAASLHRMCDIASSIGKTNSLEKNFGMGAKVATLPSNQHGLRYRSCHQGRVHQVVMGKRDGAYGRILQQGADGALADVIEVTGRAVADGRDVGSDWTEVVLLGNHPHQDTLIDPYGGAPHVAHDWIEHYLHRRFFTLPAGTQLLLGAGIHHVDGWSPFVPLGERLDTAFTRHETVIIDAGTRIHYLYDATDPDNPAHTMSMHDGHVADSGAAIIYRGEMYDFRHGHIWRHEAPIYGLTFGARNFTVLIELAEDFPVLPDGYREFMRYRADHQAQVESRHFAPKVNRHRPDWLLALLRDLAPKASHMQGARDEMLALFAKLGVRRRWWPSTPETAPEPAPEPAPQTPPAAQDVTQDPTQPHVEQPPADAPPEPPPEPDPEWEVPPQIVALRDQSDANERGIGNKVARFYTETNEIFVNCNYATISRVQDELIRDFAAEPDQSRVREVSLIVAEQLATRLACRRLAVCMGKYGTWSDWEVLHAMSPESLSIAVDDYETELSAARRQMQRQLDIADTARIPAEELALALPR